MDGRLSTCCTTCKCIPVVLSSFLKVFHPSLHAFYDFIQASAQSASHSLASQFPANSWCCKVVHCFFILAPFRGLQWIVCLYPTLSQHPSLSHQPSANPTLLHTWTFFVLSLFSPPWHLLSVSNLTACWLCTPRLLTNLYNLQIWLIQLQVNNFVYSNKSVPPKELFVRVVHIIHKATNVHRPQNENWCVTRTHTLDRKPHRLVKQTLLSPFFHVSCSGPIA